MKNLFQKFGADFRLGQFYPSYEKGLNRIVAEDIYRAVAAALVEDAMWVAICYWCEGNEPEARHYASECVKHAREYFFGKWREEVKTDLKTLDPEWWRINAPWFDQFQDALCCAASLGDWEAVRRFAQYPVKKARPGIDVSREEAAAYFALACLLREEPPAAYQDSFRLIEKGGKLKPKLIAEIIRALVAKNARAFQGSLDAYLAYFRKSEFNRKRIDKLLCLDGTTLLHIAEREGIRFELRPEFCDFIIRFS